MRHKPWPGELLAHGDPVQRQSRACMWYGLNQRRCSESAGMGQS